MSDGLRCYHVVGTVYTGPTYCGYPAKTKDSSGRPVCGVHGTSPIAKLGWAGNHDSYPLGTFGKWTFKHGDPTPVLLPDSEDQEQVW